MIDRRAVVFRIAMVLVLAAGTFLIIQPLTHSMEGRGEHLVRTYELDASAQSDKTTLLFTGDVMLARDIEVIMSTYGDRYPFTIFDALPPFRGIIGNFEAAIPENHIPTIPPSTILAAKASVVSPLRDAGFTHLSLANNHSYDFEELGFLHTRSTLQSADIKTFGHPTLVSTSSVAYVDVNGVTVAIVALHTLFTGISFAELDRLMVAVNKNSDLQVAYIHWGNEYQVTHSAAQKQLADTLVQLGIDLIVGHHPHVVQDVGFIRGVPVFYSLGNFVFDQYFGREVQEGLLLTLELAEEAQVGLYPITAVESRGQSQLMAPYERDRYLKKLGERSDPALEQWVASGKVRLQIDLASSQ